ncbi:uncharacterized protein LOC129918202 [Episyrphus balteatus]|uniref:uncharacterized protein LOC129918202 n=1 Tax=Episyrphus balteatus TaxID=286459 RepID=UPI002484EBF6|nr:uncharacterized protein LOC129918202 [Episyrphus balteatus]XP_055854574.1 uncharacterized protein LOC129918202 [Episyrphus balteatus]
MKRSVAVIIFNEESERRDELKIITNTFYRMNMLVEVLVNKPAEEIQKAIVELTEMDGDEIIDIIFVIHAKQVNDYERKFSTIDGKIFDLYKNIINYLLEVRDFKEKQKYIIFKVNGRDDNSDNLVPFESDREFRCISYGLRTSIVWSEEEEFIKKFFKDLGDHRNVSTALQNNSKLITQEELALVTGDLILEVPISNPELTSEFHEFVIG